MSVGTRVDIRAATMLVAVYPGRSLCIAASAEIISIYKEGARLTRQRLRLVRILRIVRHLDDLGVRSKYGVL
jgi:hypothetical protein